MTEIEALTENENLTNTLIQTSTFFNHQKKLKLYDMP